MLVALQFFTRIPVTGALARWVGYSPEMLRASVAHFPGVGLLMGAWSALVLALAWNWLPPTGSSPLLAAVLATAASVWLTGAFHEDGLADTADALGGHTTREQALLIMKDSRLGTYGVLALVLGIGLKLALLASLLELGDLPLCAALLLLAHALSRLCAMGVIARLPHVGDTAGSKSKPLADRITADRLWLGAAWCALAGAPLLAWGDEWLWPLAGGLLGAALALWRMLQLFAQRLQGFTGDCLGATQQVCELAFYLGVLLAWPAVGA